METKQSLTVKFSNIGIALGLSILIVVINAAILNTIVPYWNMPITTKDIPWKHVITGLTIAPLGEELIFRLIPLNFLKKTSIFEDTKWYAVALIACIFGYVHGSFYNIWIQGVAGFFFGWVYIKNGMSYWSSVATHFLYNFMIYIVFPVII